MPQPEPTAKTSMTPMEVRATASLASIYGLRLLGMFVILPVFALYAETLPGGATPTEIGVALGAYGLLQALLQVPFGVEGVERERALARTGQPGNHDEPMARQIEIQVLEVVRACAANADQIHVPEPTPFALRYVTVQLQGPFNCNAAGTA